MYKHLTIKFQLNNGTINVNKSVERHHANYVADALESYVASIRSLEQIHGNIDFLDANNNQIGTVILEIKQCSRLVTLFIT